MAAIKRFFEKRKLGIKFKKAGEGHRLSDSQSSSSNTAPAPIPQKSVASISRDPQTEAARRAAAEAAQARMEAKQQSKQADSMVIQRARMKRDMEAERKKTERSRGDRCCCKSRMLEETQDSDSQLESVFFKCSDIGPQVLTKTEMENAIHSFLLDNYEDEPEMTSAIMIHTLNKNNEKVKVCIETLVKYLDNIINNPTEEKYWKIRQSNKVFQEKVACMKGTEEFLLAAGFSLKNLPFEDGEASFYVFDSELAKDVERLQNMKEVLLHAEPLRPELDRGLKVFYPSNYATKFDIPDDFYNINPTELKKEQQRREEAAEKLGMLRTKAMREKDEQRELRKYRYTFIRVRFPDGVLLQGVFKSSESMSSVCQFVRENLASDFIPFYLSTGTGQKLQEKDATLAELLFAPATVLNFSWDSEIMAEVAAQQGQAITKVHLKPQVMALITNL
uniref:UBX domain-containing protein n=1 Tax=Arion vulgaris TaxID=1028688 RepID=A0A0B7ADQ2_9EUPU